MRSDDNLPNFQILSDPKVEQIDCGQSPVPDNWQSRRLYVRQNGAQNWCNVVHHSSYPLQGGDPYDLNKNRAVAADLVSAATMVSLGPGDALHDIPIVEKLSQRVPSLSYISLDLSRFLLELAIRNMQPHVKVPFGIQCDFEQIPDQLAASLAELAPRPVFFSMLGGTVGNLDLGEKNFFDKMLSLMGKDDHFLIDVPLAGPGWTPERDPRFDKGAYTPEFKQFIAFGLAGFEPESKGSKVSEILQERIDCRIDNGGDIPNTNTVTIFDRRANQVILKFRRYDWESIVSWLADQGFDVIFHRCSLKNTEDVFGMGIILIGPRSS